MLTGFDFRPIAVANTPEELDYFVVQEASLPQLSRILIEVPLDPSEDISSIAQQIQAACEENYIPYWPEYPNTYTFIENNTLYIAYVKPAGDISPAAFPIIPILIGIVILAPIIMFFAIPGFAQLVNSIVMLVMMVVMLDIMTPMMKEIPGKPVEPRPPLEQRISRKIESVAESVARIEASVRKIGHVGATEVRGAASDITGLAKAVRDAPETAMTGYQKAKAAEDLGGLHKKLKDYEEHLTPSQKEKLKEERHIVEELKAMYD